MANVGEIMTRDIKACRSGDSLEKAAMRMWEDDIGCVPILDGEDRPIGMLTDRDICMAAYIEGKPLSSLPVESAMSKQLFACAPGDSLQAAETLMKSHQVRRVPVVDGGKLVGILAMNDLARAAATRKGQKHNGVSAEEVEATLAAICQPRRPTVPAA